MTLARLRTDQGRGEAGRAARLDEAYFGEAFAAFDAVARRVGTIETDLVLGGLRVRVRVAGEPLAGVLLRSLAPRASGPRGSPALSLDVLDSSSGPPVFPAPPWMPGDYFLRDEVLNLPRGLRASYSLTSGVLSLLDGDARRGLFRVPGAVPAWDRGTPLRNLLHWGLEPHGLRIVHAAGVGRESGGVLLAGPGGSGKSTAALACLTAGMGFLGDDHTLVSLDPEPLAFGLYGVAKVDTRSLELVPGFAAEGPPEPGGKSLAYLGGRFAELLIERFPVRALVLPHVGSRTGRLQGPISAAETLRTLGPSTIFQLPGAGQEAFRLLARLVRAVPSFRLEVGPDVSTVASVVEELLSQFGGAAG